MTREEKKFILKWFETNFPRMKFEIDVEINDISFGYKNLPIWVESVGGGELRVHFHNLNSLEDFFKKYGNHKLINSCFNNSKIPADRLEMEMDILSNAK